MNEPRFNVIALVRFIVRPLDPWLLLIVGLLIAYGYVLMMSASPDRLDSLQLHIGIALVSMWCVAALPLRRLLGLAVPLYVIGLVLLVGVALFGEISKGAQRWLDLGVVRIQPSELMKVAAPLMLVWYFQTRTGLLRWFDFVIGMLLLALPLGLIVIQPDLGTAVLVASAGLYVLYLAGLSWKLIVPVVAIVVAGMVAIVGFGDVICQPDVDWHILREYQKHRVCTLLDPSQDPLDRGFHIIQSTIAIGSGGLFGKGWMEGTQTHLAFLPERHTDFIFAVLAEEFGMVGALVLLALYVVLIARGFIIAGRSRMLAGRLLGGAMSLMFFTYAFVNMGMVSGILPVVGVPLPFVSYGGTALVTLCIGVGILMSIKHSRALERE